MPKFNPIFLEEADEFLDDLDVKIKAKILYNIAKAQQLNDPKLFKKLTTEIWEFRTKYENLQYRLFAFWDKRDKQDTLVICTHGIIKKTDKVPAQDIEKAERVRKNYFENH